MTQIEEDLIDIANEGQSGEKKYKGEGFTRLFAGRVKDVVKLRNPLELLSIIYEINKILVIINPELISEIEWLEKLKRAIKIFYNEILHTNRLLGIKNDNQYDVRLFEEVVMQKFMLQIKEKPKPETLIQTDFKTMVEMVELGVRRFGRN